MERKTTLHELIWNYRHDNDLTLRAMGKLLGCSGAFVGKLEKEEVFPSVKLLRSISSLLEIPLEDLIKITYREENGLYKTYLTEQEMVAR